MSNMDIPPNDYGSDRYDYVEVTSPYNWVPSGPWWDILIAEPCVDCRANVFAELRRDVTGGGWMSVVSPHSWKIQIAHDTGCPRLQQEER